MKDGAKKKIVLLIISGRVADLHVSDRALERIRAWGFTFLGESASECDLYGEIWIIWAQAWLDVDWRASAL
jgi:hypothetical protein